ncbi:MAG TPA: AarF/ABC1/UbiB kinase family protein [Thermoleophilaceae bacterium]|nr:AarF/ABC1/UbiB kinase family protein [Thermoleophilaceae bacterium]
MSDRIPTSRLRRAARTTSALAPGTLRLATSIATSAGRDPEKAAELLAKRHEELADEVLDVLSSLRGGAMKIGQMASFIDVDFIPAEYRDTYQAKLAALRDSAPPMSWKQVRSVLEREWGEEPESVLEDLDHDASAAASIGQVHRGRLPDGREVAVKVQYPEIADALEADLGTAAIVARLGKAIAPGVDPDLIMDEIRERVLEELDYELEAQNQRAFARAYRGHPFAHVPDVVTSLSARRVLVSDWVDGRPFAEMLALPDDERGRIGEIIYRFFYGSLHWLGRFNVDAHPGNYLLLDDGRIAFIDFGSVKEMDAERLRTGLRLMMAATEPDDQVVVGVLRELGYVRPRSEPNAALLAAQVRVPNEWVLTDAEFTLDRPYVARLMALESQINAETLRLARTLSLPADDLMLNRMGIGVVAVLGQLGVTRNWYRMAREAWFGDPPATELGAAEVEFFRRRGIKRLLER